MHINRNDRLVDGYNDIYLNHNKHTIKYKIMMLGICNPYSYSDRRITKS